MQAIDDDPAPYPEATIRASADLGRRVFRWVARIREELYGLGVPSV